ncbi:hypothetical protein D3C81_1890890 [compost metagenome]
MRLFGEQGVDPFALGNHLGTNRQCSQVAVGGNVVQRFFVQLVGVEEGLQAVQLLGEGHYRATLGINDDRILASCGACEAKMTPIAERPVRGDARV